MRKDQRRFFLLAFVPIYAIPLITASDFTRPIFLSLGSLYLAVIGAASVAGRKREKAEREKAERELRRQRTAELERELGIEPLNLDDLDPIFEEIEREKRQ